MTFAYLPLLRLAPCCDATLRIHLQPTLSSALSTPSLSLCLSFYFPLSLLPFHLDIPSPPSSLRHRVATLRWVLVRLFLLLILLLLRLLLLLLFYLAASSLVLFLVYFSHPRTVEMQFASELLLPPSQPVAASNNRRRSKQLTHQGEFVVSEEEISLI